MSEKPEISLYILSRAVRFHLKHKFNPKDPKTWKCRIPKTYDSDALNLPTSCPKEQNLKAKCGKTICVFCYKMKRRPLGFVWGDGTGGGMIMDNTCQIDVTLTIFWAFSQQHDLIPTLKQICDSKYGGTLGEFTLLEVLRFCKRGQVLMAKNVWLNLLLSKEKISKHADGVWDITGGCRTSFDTFFSAVYQRELIAVCSANTCTNKERKIYSPTVKLFKSQCLNLEQICIGHRRGSCNEPGCSGERKSDKFIFTRPNPWFIVVDLKDFQLKDVPKLLPKSATIGGKFFKLAGIILFFPGHVSALLNFNDKYYFYDGASKIAIVERFPDDEFSREVINNRFQVLTAYYIRISD